MRSHCFRRRLNSERSTHNLTRVALSYGIDQVSLIPVQGRIHYNQVFIILTRPYIMAVGFDRMCSSSDQNVPFGK